MKRISVLNMAAVALLLSSGAALACAEHQDQHAAVPTTTDEARAQSHASLGKSVSTLFSSTKDNASTVVAGEGTAKELNEIVPASGGSDAVPTTLDQMRGIR